MTDVAAPPRVESRPPSFTLMAAIVVREDLIADAEQRLRVAMPELEVVPAGVPAASGDKWQRVRACEWVVAPPNDTVTLAAALDVLVERLEATVVAIAAGSITDVCVSIAGAHVFLDAMLKPRSRTALEQRLDQRLDTLGVPRINALRAAPHVTRIISVTGDTEEALFEALRARIEADAPRALAEQVLVDTYPPVPRFYARLAVIMP
jgi:hypothetical protein